MIQAVILAAGNSTRMYPLTLTRPKPMLPLMNRPILEHILDSLIEAERVDEAIIVIGYKGEMIKQYFGDKYKSLSLKYFHQEQQKGTWDAVYQVKEMIVDRFLVLYGDNIHSSQDIKRCTDYTNALLLAKTKTPEQFGIATLDGYFVKDIIEKPWTYVGDLASTGVLMFDRNAFKYQPEISNAGEFFLTGLVKKICAENPVYGLMANGYWLQHSYPWDLLNSNEFLMAKVNDSKIESKIEDDAIIKSADIEGKVWIGKGAIIRNSVIGGPVIIGDNCSIGPFARIRPGTVIGDNCKIGEYVSIKNSIIMGNTSIPHFNLIGDSIIGEHVNFGAYAKVMNRKNNPRDPIIRSKVNGILIPTGRRKFGAVVGDGAQIGGNNTIKYGRKIWPGAELDIDLTIDEDIIKSPKPEQAKK